MGNILLQLHQYETEGEMLLLILHMFYIVAYWFYNVYIAFYGNFSFLQLL